MDVVSSSFLPGDPRLIDQIVYELKSQGIFDQFRKECIADVDTKPAYQNLSQRVEGSVMNFLNKQTFAENLNKNQLREQLRKNIAESGFLDSGVERIVDQVVNPKINTVFLPKVEEVVYRFLGLERPNDGEQSQEIKPAITKIDDLLPTDLEAVSPESVHDISGSTENKEEIISTNNDTNSLNSSTNKTDDESPAFEPIDEGIKYTAYEENSVDSHLSGISALTNHDSVQSNDMQISNQMDISLDVSQNSFNSEGKLSIVTSEEETKMCIAENIATSVSENKPEVNVEIEKQQEFKKEDQELKADSTVKVDTRDMSQSKADEKIEEINKNQKENETEVDSGKKIESKKTDDAKTESKKSHDRHKSSRSDRDKKDDRDKSRTKSDSKSKESREKSSSKHSSSSRNKDKDKTNGKDESVVKDKSSKKDDKGHDKEKGSSSSKVKDGKDKTKEKSDKERDRSEKDKNSKEKDHRSHREKSEKEKTKSDKDKSDKDKDKAENDRHKSSKEKSDKDKNKNDKDKSISSDKHSKEKSSSSHKKDDKSESKSSKEKSSSSKDRSSSSSKSKESSHKDKESSKSSKDKEKSKSSSSSSSKDKEKDRERDRKSGGDSKSKSSDKDKSKKNDKEKLSSHDKHSSSSKKEKDKKVVDDHYSLKDKKHDRRSSDRDSNDGSGKSSRNGSFADGFSNSHKSYTSRQSSEVFSSGAGESSNSDPIEQKPTEGGTKPSINLAGTSDAEATPIKYIKPKFASNIHEAMKIMKIRKQLAKLERENQLALVNVPLTSDTASESKVSKSDKDSKAKGIKEISPKHSKSRVQSILESKVNKSNDKKAPELDKKRKRPVKDNQEQVKEILSLKSQDLSMETFEALEARLALEMSNLNDRMYSYEDDEDFEYSSINISPLKKPKLMNDSDTAQNKVQFSDSPQSPEFRECILENLDNSPVEKYDFEPHNDSFEEHVPTTVGGIDARELIANPEPPHITADYEAPQIIANPEPPQNIAGPDSLQNIAKQEPPLPELSRNIPNPVPLANDGEYLSTKQLNLFSLDLPNVILDSKDEDAAKTLTKDFETTKDVETLREDVVDTLTGVVEKPTEDVSRTVTEEHEILTKHAEETISENKALEPDGVETLTEGIDETCENVETLFKFIEKSTKVRINDDIKTIAEDVKTIAENVETLDDVKTLDEDDIKTVTEDLGEVVLETSTEGVVKTLTKDVFSKPSETLLNKCNEIQNLLIDNESLQTSEQVLNEQDLIIVEQISTESQEKKEKSVINQEELTNLLENAEIELKTPNQTKEENNEDLVEEFPQVSEETVKEIKVSVKAGTILEGESTEAIEETEVILNEIEVCSKQIGTYEDAGHLDVSDNISPVGNIKSEDFNGFTTFEQSNDISTRMLKIMEKISSDISKLSRPKKKSKNIKYSRTELAKSQRLVLPRKVATKPTLGSPTTLRKELAPIKDLLVNNGQKLFIKIDNVHIEITPRVLNKLQDIGLDEVVKKHISQATELICDLTGRPLNGSRRIQKTVGRPNQTRNDPQLNSDSDDGPCYYFDKSDSVSDSHLAVLNGMIRHLEKSVEKQSLKLQNNIPKPKTRGRKRKIPSAQSTENNNSLSCDYKPERKRRLLSDANSNQNEDNLCNTGLILIVDVTSHQNFSLPLSPADSDKSGEHKKAEPVTVKTKRTGRGSVSKRYSNNELYKPRPILSCTTTRRRSGRADSNSRP